MNNQIVKMLADLAADGVSEQDMVRAVYKVFGYYPKEKELKKAKASVKVVRFRVSGSLPHLIVRDATNRQQMAEASDRFVGRLCADAYKRGLQLPNMTREQQVERAMQDPDFRL